MGSTDRPIAAEPPIGSTFLFTDVVGSTRRWEADPHEMSAALAEHDGLVARAVGAAGGTLLKSKGEGDSTVSVFAEPRHAVSAAIEIQRSLRGALTVRMAIHRGPAELRDGDYYGPTLNRAARIRATAHGGQIVVSDSVADAVGRDELTDLGSHRLKDLTHPEHLWQVVHPDLETSFPPLLSLSARPTNLPSPPTSFVGRGAEVTSVRELVASCRLTTLTGAGGSGKTRLAIQVGADLVEDFADGVWLAELAPVDDPGVVPSAVAQMLRIPTDGAPSATEAIVDHLAAKRALIVLDNCEHVVDAAAALIEAVLHRAPDVQVLATSRERLRLPSEVAWPVPVLGLPDEGTDPTGSEAVRLFVDRATAARPGLVWDDDNLAAAAVVCRQVDGIPLAIELAAARVNTLTLPELAARLGERMKILTSGSRTALPRHQSLRAAIEWSHSLLTTDEQAALRRLAVFRGGWILATAEELVELPAAVDALAGLVDKSLVAADEVAGEARYRMLETIRELALEHLRRAGEHERFAQRHAAAMLARVRRLYQRFLDGDQANVLSAADAEVDNMRAAIAWGCEHDIELAVGLIEIVGRYATVRGMREEATGWVRRLLPHAARLDDASRIALLQMAGDMIAYRGDPHEGLAMVDEVVTIARAHEDWPALANGLSTSALILRLLGRRDEAVAAFEESIAVADRHQTPGGSLRTRALLGGWLHTEARSDATGEERLQHLVTEAQAGGDALSEVIALNALARGWPRTTQSERYARAALARAEEIGFTQFAVDTRALLAALQAARGDIAGAIAEYQELRRTAVTLGHRAIADWARLDLATLLRVAGDLDEAERLAHEVIGDGGDQVGIRVASRGVLALILRDRGDHAGARAAISEVDPAERPLPSATGVLAAVAAADPDADALDAATAYWVARREVESGTEWDAALFEFEWHRLPVMLDARLGPDRMSHAANVATTLSAVEGWELARRLFDRR